ncbi:MAG: hypothetical protein ABIS14_08035 [Sphingomonas sp.]
MADTTSNTPKPAPSKTPATPRATTAKPAAAAPRAGAEPESARASKPKAAAKTATEKAQATFADLTGTTTQSLKDGASKLTRDAADKARTYAEDGKARAGGVLDELSRMMSEAAGTVDEKVGAQYGQYARTAADAVSNFSSSLKSKNVDDLLGEAREFAKKSPAVAIGTAAALGFVLARLIKSGFDADDRA